MPSTVKTLALLAAAIFPAIAAADMPRPNSRPNSRPNTGLVYGYERVPVGNHLRPATGVLPAAYQEAIPANTPMAIDAPPAVNTAAAVPLPRRREPPLRLRTQGRSDSTQSGDRTQSDGSRSGSLDSLVPVVGSLGLVVGLFLLVAWGMRRATPRSMATLPGEVFEVLGRAPLAGRQQVHMLRCGKRLILVSTTEAGAETLTEIDDPLEVDRLAGLCRQTHPSSATAAFRQVFQQMAPRNAAAAAREEHQTT